AGWAAGYIAPGAIVRIPELSDALVEYPWVGAAAALLVIVGMAWLATRMALPVRLWIWGTVALAPFYIFVLPAIWGFHRYLLPVRASATLLIATGLASLAERIAARVRSYAAWGGAAVLLGNGVLGVAGTLAGPTRGGIDGTTGYREAALSVFSAIGGNG